MNKLYVFAKKNYKKFNIDTNNEFCKWIKNNKKVSDDELKIYSLMMCLWIIKNYFKAS